MNKRYYISLIVLSLCSVLAGGVYFLTLKSVSKKAEAIATYKNDILFADQKKKYAEVMLSSFYGAQSDITNLQEFFVKKQGEVEFIESIEKVAKNQNLAITIDTVSVDQSNDIDVRGVEYLTLRFHVSGAWSDVWTFSRMLEVLPYAIDVNSVALVRDDPSVVVKNKPNTWKGVYIVNVLKKK